MYGNEQNTRVLVLDDNSGFFIIVKNNISGLVNIWKYLFSVSSSAQCQEVPTMSVYAYGHLNFNINEIFVIGIDPSTYSMHFFELTFGNTSVNWGNQLLCSSGTCTMSVSQCKLSNDSSTIYAIPAFGSSVSAYLIAFNATSGAIIGSRYKSSSSWSGIFGSALEGNVLAFSTQCSGYSLLLYNILTSFFTIKQFAGALTSGTIDYFSQR